MARVPFVLTAQQLTALGDDHIVHTHIFYNFVHGLFCERRGSCSSGQYSQKKSVESQ